MLKAFCDICKMQISDEQKQLSDLCYASELQRRGFQAQNFPKEHFCKKCLPKGVDYWFSILPELTRQAAADLRAKEKKQLSKLKSRPFPAEVKSEGGAGVRPN